MMDTCADPAGRTVNSRDGRQQKSSTEGQERDSDDRGQRTKLYGKGDLFLGEGMRDISSLQFASQEAIPACVVKNQWKRKPWSTGLWEQSVMLQGWPAVGFW